MAIVELSNHLLSRLSPDSRAAVVGVGHFVELDVGSVLASAGQATEHVHFVERGLLSIIVGEDRGTPIEVGVTGPEGLSGGWLALADDASPFTVIVQAAGRALRMTRHAFRQSCADDPHFSAIMLGYAQQLTRMVAETCWANARLTVEGRVAKWLLRAHERIDADELAITHDTLSRMLGVRRPGVTVALHVLEGEHIIKARRGLIRIIDREKLQAAAQNRDRRAAPGADRIGSGRAERVRVADLQASV